MLCCQQLPSGEWLQFISRIFQLLSTPLPFDAFNERIPSSYRVHIWSEKTRMAGLQSGESRMMIAVWAQYINVTDTRTDTQTHLHVANVVPMYCVEWLKSVNAHYTTLTARKPNKTLGLGQFHVLNFQFDSVTDLVLVLSSLFAKIPFWP